LAALFAAFLYTAGSLQRTPSPPASVCVYAIDSDVAVYSDRTSLLIGLQESDGDRQTDNIWQQGSS